MELIKSRGNQKDPYKLVLGLHGILRICMDWLIKLQWHWSRVCARPEHGQTETGQYRQAVYRPMCSKNTWLVYSYVIHAHHFYWKFI